MNKVYVVTAHGMMIDTICEVFKTKEDALHFIQEQWDNLKGLCGEVYIDTIVENRIWKSSCSYNESIEWEIHTREI